MMVEQMVEDLDGVKWNVIAQYHTVQQQSYKKVSIAQLPQACFDWLSPFRISVFLLFPV